MKIKKNKLNDLDTLRAALTIVEDYLLAADDNHLKRSVMVLYDTLGQAIAILNRYKEGNRKGGATTQAGLNKEERIAKARKAGNTYKANIAARLAASSK